MDKTCLTNNILNIQCRHSTLGVTLSDHLSAGTRKVVCLDRYNIATGYVLDILRGYRPFTSAVTTAHKFTFDRSEKVKAAKTFKSTVKARSAYVLNEKVVVATSIVESRFPPNAIAAPVDRVSWVEVLDDPYDTGSNTTSMFYLKVPGPLPDSYPWTSASGGTIDDVFFAIPNDQVYLSNATLTGAGQGKRAVQYYNGATLVGLEYELSQSTNYNLAQFAVDVENDFKSKNPSVDITVEPIAEVAHHATGVGIRLQFKITYFGDEATINGLNQIHKISIIPHTPISPTDAMEIIIPNGTYALAPASSTWVPEVRRTSGPAGSTLHLGANHKGLPLGIDAIDPANPTGSSTADSGFEEFIFRGDINTFWGDYAAFPPGEYPDGKLIPNDMLYMGTGTLTASGMPWGSGRREVKYYDGTVVTLPQGYSTTYTLADFATDIENDFSSRNGGAEIIVTPVAHSDICSPGGWGDGAFYGIYIYFEIEYLSDEYTVTNVINQIDGIKLLVHNHTEINFLFNDGTDLRKDWDTTTPLYWEPGMLTTTLSTTSTGAAALPATVTMTLKDNSLTNYVGAGDGTDIAIHFETLIEAGGLTVDYKVERVDNVLYVYSYSSGASFSDSATTTSDTTKVTAIVVSLENKLDEILDIWNSLTQKELCNLITFATATSGKTAGGSTTSSGGCNC